MAVGCPVLKVQYSTAAFLAALVQMVTTNGYKPITVQYIQYSTYRHSTYSTVHTAQYIQHSTYSTVHTAQFIQHSTYSTVHTAQYIQHSTYSTVQYSTVQYSTVQYSTVQYSTVQYSTVQYSTVQYSTVQYSTVRVAACKDDRIHLRNFVPPQYYNRYMFLSKRCAELRGSDRQKKTQLRFNNCDIEVLIKDRGSSEPYRVIKHEEICNLVDLPEYNYQQEWRVRRDRPVRTVVRSPNRGAPPSLSESAAMSHPLSRDNSLEMAPRKKQKLTKTPEAAKAVNEEEDIMDEEEEEEI